MKTTASLAKKGGSRHSGSSFCFGWYGDNGLGEELIQKVLSGRKKATMAPAYDRVEGEVGEIIRMVDKTGRERALLRVTSVEFLEWKDLSQEQAAKLDLTFDQIRDYFKKDLARDFRPDEEVCVTSFEIAR